MLYKIVNNLHTELSKCFFDNMKFNRKTDCLLMNFSKKKAKNHLNDNKQIFIVRMLALGSIISNSFSYIVR